ncbi:MAG TPA: response regulator [bacterium]|nr:response regulator [bacterium]
MEEHTVLLVDDESYVLDALKRLLKEEQISIVTATSGQDALKILEAQKVSLVMTDQRMPAMTGLDLLKEIKMKYPNTVRVIVTGYTDLDVVIKAINEGEVYRFIPKPWNEEELKMTIRQALAQYDLLEDNKALLHVVSSQKEVIQEAEKKIPEFSVMAEKAKGHFYVFEGTPISLEEFMKRYYPKKEENGNNNSKK